MFSPAMKSLGERASHSPPSGQKWPDGGIGEWVHLHMLDIILIQFKYTRTVVKDNVEIMTE